MRKVGNGSDDLPIDEAGEEQVVLAEQGEESSSAVDDDDLPKSLAASSISTGKQGANSSTSSGTGTGTSSVDVNVNVVADVNANVNADADADAKIEIKTETNTEQSYSDTSTLQSDAEDIQASCVDTSDTAAETSTAPPSSKDKDDRIPNPPSSPTKESVTKISPSSSKPEPVEAPASDRVPVQPEPRPKVKVHLIAVGNAPILKKTKFLLSPTEQFGTLVERLRKMLKLTGPSLFLYINQSFVPSLEDLIGELGDLFSVRGELQVHYSIQEAWG